MQAADDEGPPPSGANVRQSGANLSAAIAGIRTQAKAVPSVATAEAGRDDGSTNSSVPASAVATFAAAADPQKDDVTSRSSAGSATAAGTIMSSGRGGKTKSGGVVVRVFPTFIPNAKHISLLAFPDDTCTSFTSRVLDKLRKAELPLPAGPMLVSMEGDGLLHEDLLLDNFAQLSSKGDRVLALIASAASGPVSSTKGDLVNAQESGGGRSGKRRGSFGSRLAAGFKNLAKTAAHKLDTVRVGFWQAVGRSSAEPETPKFLALLDSVHVTKRTFEELLALSASVVETNAGVILRARTFLDDRIAPALKLEQRYRKARLEYDTQYLAFGKLTAKHEQQTGKSSTSSGGGGVTKKKLEAAHRDVILAIDSLNSAKADVKAAVTRICSVREEVFKEDVKKLTAVLQRVRPTWFLSGTLRHNLALERLGISKGHPMTGREKAGTLTARQAVPPEQWPQRRVRVKGMSNALVWKEIDDASLIRVGSHPGKKKRRTTQPADNPRASVMNVPETYPVGYVEGGGWGVLSTTFPSNVDVGPRGTRKAMIADLIPGRRLLVRSRLAICIAFEFPFIYWVPAESQHLTADDCMAVIRRRKELVEEQEEKDELPDLGNVAILQMNGVKHRSFVIDDAMFRVFVEDCGIAPPPDPGSDPMSNGYSSSPVVDDVPMPSSVLAILKRKKTEEEEKEKGAA